MDRIGTAMHDKEAHGGTPRPAGVGAVSGKDPRGEALAESSKQAGEARSTRAGQGAGPGTGNWFAKAESVK